MENNTIDLERFANWASVLTIYFSIVGLLYLYGYWSSFHINILEYLSFSDVIKSALYPVSNSYLAILVLAILNDFIFGQTAAGRHKVRYGDTNLSRSFWILPLGIIMFAAAAFYLDVFAWIIIPPTLSFLFLALAKPSNLVFPHIGNEGLRSFSIFVIASLPIYSLGQGYINSHFIISGQSYSYLQSRPTGIFTDDKWETSDRYRIVGHYNGVLFLYSPQDSSMVLAKLGDEFTLKIARSENRTRFPLK